MGLLDSPGRGSRPVISKRVAPPLLAAAAASVIGLLSPETALAQRSPQGQVQIGPDFGLIERPARANDASIAYEPGIAYGAHAQILTAPWLRFSVYYLRAQQPLTVPDGSLRAGTTVEGGKHLSSYVLGARVQPTLNLGSRLHLWANAGAGWGKVSVPALDLEDASGSMRVAERDGVLVEIPLGLGGSFDIIERWLAISVDATYAFALQQSGDVYRAAQVIDAKGAMTQVGPMPKLDSAMTATISLLIEL